MHACKKTYSIYNLFINVKLTLKYKVFIKHSCSRLLLTSTPILLINNTKVSMLGMETIYTIKYSYCTFVRVIYSSKVLDFKLNICTMH